MYSWDREKIKIVDKFALKEQSSPTATSETSENLCLVVFILSFVSFGVHV